MQSESLIFIWMLHLTFFLSSLYSASFIHYQKTIKFFSFLEISLIFLYNFCLFPRHPTFFFFWIGIWYRNFLYFDSSFSLANSKPPVSTLYHVRFLPFFDVTSRTTVWRNKNEKNNAKIQADTRRLWNVRRRAASKRVRTHCSRRKPLATEENITR